MKQGLTYFHIHFFHGKIPLPFTFNHVINAAIRVGLEEYNFLPFNNPSPQGGLNVLNNTALTLEQGDTLGKVSHLFLQLLRDLCQGKSQFRLLQCNFCRVGLRRGGGWGRTIIPIPPAGTTSTRSGQNHPLTTSSGSCTGKNKRNIKGTKATDVDWTKFKLADWCRGLFFYNYTTAIVATHMSYRPSQSFISSGIFICICSPLTLLSAQIWQGCQRWPSLPSKAVCKDEALPPRWVSIQPAIPVTFLLLLFYFYSSTSTSF